MPFLKFFRCVTCVVNGTVSEIKKSKGGEWTEDNKTSKCVRRIGILALCLVTRNNKIEFPLNILVD